MKGPRDSSVPFPGPEQPTAVTGALVCNPLHCNGYHCIPLRMYSIGMVWIPLVWIPIHSSLVPPTRADTVNEQDPMLPLGSRKGNPLPERVFQPAGGRQTTVRPAPCARAFGAR